jgi:hypothetical protein
MDGSIGRDQESPLHRSGASLAVAAVPRHRPAPKFPQNSNPLCDLAQTAPLCPHADGRMVRNFSNFGEILDNGVKRAFSGSGEEEEYGCNCPLGSLENNPKNLANPWRD